MRDPVLMPVTTLNVGRVPEAVQPFRKPAPNAPLAPPPDSARTLQSDQGSAPILTSGLYWEPHRRTSENPGSCPSEMRSRGTGLRDRPQPERRIVAATTAETAANLCRPCLFTGASRYSPYSPFTGIRPQDMEQVVNGWVQCLARPCVRH